MKYIYAIIYWCLFNIYVLIINSEIYIYYIELCNIYDISLKNDDIN